MTSNVLNLIRYHNAKANGFCAVCGNKLPKDNGFVYCDKCRAKAREVYHKNKFGRKCINCGKPAAPRKQRCNDCLREARLRSKKTYKDDNIIRGKEE